MGYIMPVDRYQYANYQEWMRTRPSSVSAVDPAFRVVLERKYEAMIREYDRVSPNINRRVPNRPVRSNAVDRAYAEITGKGKKFNTIV